MRKTGYPTDMKRLRALVDMSSIQRLRIITLLYHKRGPKPTWVTKTFTFSFTVQKKRKYSFRHRNHRINTLKHWHWHLLAQTHWSPEAPTFYAHIFSDRSTEGLCLTWDTGIKTLGAGPFLFAPLQWSWSLHCKYHNYVRKRFLRVEVAPSYLTNNTQSSCHQQMCF